VSGGQSLISIVLVSYNTLTLLKQNIPCLVNLRSSCPTELLIVDNGSTDKSREWLAGLEGDRVRVFLLNENRGFAAGCNIGIDKASGRYILLLNTDAFLTSEALDVLVTYLDHHPDVGIVGPQLLYPNDRWQRSTGLVPSPKSAMLDALGITSLGHFVSGALWRPTGRWWRPRRVGYVDAACMLIRREVIDQIGGLDESFFFFVEDAEFCYRARQHGWKTMYVPQSQVVHLRGASSSQKDFQQSLKMRVCSERAFILRIWEEGGWHRFAFWRRLNYRWRMGWSLMTRAKERYQRYQTAWRVYGEMSS